MGGSIGNEGSVLKMGGNEFSVVKIQATCYDVYVNLEEVTDMSHFRPFEEIDCSLRVFGCPFEELDSIYKEMIMFSIVENDSAIIRHFSVTQKSIMIRCDESESEEVAAEASHSSALHSIEIIKYKSEEDAIYESSCIEFEELMNQLDNWLVTNILTRPSGVLRNLIANYDFQQYV